MSKKMTKREIEKLAKEIRQFLLDHDLWVDVNIYFNGKAFSTDDRQGHYYYNDPEHLVVLDDENPRDYFEYVGNILSMSFEGPLYDVLNSYWGALGYRLEEEFRSIFEKHGLYYELGNAWNLSAYCM